MIENPIVYDFYGVFNIYKHVIVRPKLITVWACNEMGALWVSKAKDENFMDALVLIPPIRELVLGL